MSFVLSSLWLLMSFVHATTISAFESDSSPYKALVFLSDECPCSRSHIEHLNQLAKQGLKLYGVISEPLNDSMSVERQQRLKKYFEESHFDFPLIEDPQQSLVKKYNALKTPHVTLFEKVKEAYKVIYEGGVTNQKDFSKSTEKYLEENWLQIKAGKPLKFTHGFSLGCYIRRI